MSEKHHLSVNYIPNCTKCDSVKSNLKKLEKKFAKLEKKFDKLHVDNIKLSTQIVSLQLENTKRLIPTPEPDFSSTEEFKKINVHDKKLSEHEKKISKQEKKIVKLEKKEEKIRNIVENLVKNDKAIVYSKKLIGQMVFILVDEIEDWCGCDHDDVNYSLDYTEIWDKLLVDEPCLQKYFSEVTDPRKMDAAFRTCRELCSYKPPSSIDFFEHSKDSIDSIVEQYFGVQPIKEYVLKIVEILFLLHDSCTFSPELLSEIVADF